MADLEKKTEKAEAITASDVVPVASLDRDENYDFYKQHQGLEYTPEEEKKVVRKIDLHLIPLLFLIYLLQVSIPDVSWDIHRLTNTAIVPGQE